MPRTRSGPSRPKGGYNILAHEQHTHELATRPSSPHLHAAYSHPHPPEERQQQAEMTIKAPSLQRTSSRESLLSTSSSASSASALPPSPGGTSDGDGEVDGRGVGVRTEEGRMDLATPSVQKIGAKGWTIRALALLCACALSVGSHYAQYFLGPIKSRLGREMGTSNAQFSLLIASFSLNNTWTPLLGGLLTARLGTAWSSIIATSLIFFGQLILLIGDALESVRLMSLGLFVFGLGISPLAVVQETIIVRFFSSHGLGISLALGLLAGKGASFVSAITSFPLSEQFGPRAPFVVATLLAAFSWGVNLVYLSCSAWFARGTGVGLEEGEARAAARRAAAEARAGAGGGLSAVERMSEAEAMKKVERKRRVRFGNIVKLGDIFWAYVGINVLCGAIWAPFLHLSANIIERRYGLTEGDAGSRASLLMAGSIFLYPICGYLTDRLKTATVVHKMFVLSSLLTLVCYSWLALPASWTRTPTPALLAFGGGHGFATLLLVIIVPHLVPIKYVSSALGVHKALEQTGSTISQTLAGLLLDKTRSSAPDTPNNLHAISLLLYAFLAVNVFQLFGALGLWRMQVLRDRGVTAAGAQANNKGYMSLPVDEAEDGALVPEASLDAEISAPAGALKHLRTLSQHSTRPLLTKPKRRASRGNMMARSAAERRRGKKFMILGALAILAAWALFMVVAWQKLDEKAQRR
ncbi:MFS general substrate transporter [Calocera viscosa TUFC12733]|uniref:Lysosomal dipeptide transporter MFSD1 n=1 Tax=Calocera viscosa (strain TUFC12733) TaxID=1330018 RepID=A0A167JF38_CALVF|nr:MFS general substrate transporter [Calocera viscosa TUFC12733]